MTTIVKTMQVVLMEDVTHIEGNSVTTRSRSAAYVTAADGNSKRQICVECRG